MFQTNPIRRKIPRRVRASSRLLAAAQVRSDQQFERVVNRETNIRQRQAGSPNTLAPAAREASRKTDEPAQFRRRVKSSIANKRRDRP